jgi:hypothetical protein
VVEELEPKSMSEPTAVILTLKVALADDVAPEKELDAV